jgi:hypothetical protein
LQYVTDNAVGKKELADNYGSISPASLGAILRSIVAMEQQGATSFFGEPSFAFSRSIWKNFQNADFYNSVFRNIDSSSF